MRSKKNIWYLTTRNYTFYWTGSDFFSIHKGLCHHISPSSLSVWQPLPCGRVMGLLESLVRSRCVQAQVQGLVMKTGSVAQWGSVTKPQGTDRSAECSMFLLIIQVTTESRTCSWSFLLLLCLITCWYEVVYTITFCCWPSAVIIPAGSGFADEKRNMSIKENNLEVSNMQRTTCSRSLLA